MSRKEEYRWYKSIGICPYMPQKQQYRRISDPCLECRLKMRE